MRRGRQIAVLDAVGVGVGSYDSPRSIDRAGLIAEDACGVVDRGVLAAAQQVAVGESVGVNVDSRDLPAVVDPAGGGAEDAGGVVERGELAAAELKPVQHVV